MIRIFSNNTRRISGIGKSDFFTGIILTAQFSPSHGFRFVGIICNPCIFQSARITVTRIFLRKQPVIYLLFRLHIMPSVFSRRPLRHQVRLIYLYLKGFGQIIPQLIYYRNGGVAPCTFVEGMVIPQIAVLFHTVQSFKQSSRRAILLIVTAKLHIIDNHKSCPVDYFLPIGNPYGSVQHLAEHIHRNIVKFRKPLPPPLGIAVFSYTQWQLSEIRHPYQLWSVHHGHTV